MTCPNINSKEWKNLVRKYGLDITKALYVKNNEEIPSLAKAKEMTGSISEEDVHKASSLQLEALPFDQDVFTDGLTKVSRLKELKEKSISALTKKLEIQIRHGLIDRDEIDKKEGFIKELDKLEDEAALIRFIAQAATSTDTIMRDYDKIKAEIKTIKDGTSNKKEEDVLTPGMLYRWKDYLSAYDDIEDIQSALEESGLLKGKEDLNKTLSDTIKFKNILTGLYETKGLDMLSKILAPHYGKIRKDFEEQVRTQYKNLSEKDKIKLDMSEEAYVTQQKLLNTQDLTEKTELILRGELLKASKDISILSRWMETALDASDPVVAACAKAMSIAVMNAEHKTMMARESIVEALREVEKQYGTTNNKKKLFSPLLEKDENGNETGRLVDRFGHNFWDAYNDFRTKLKETPDITNEIFKSKIKYWLRQNTKFDDKGFQEAKWSVLEQMVRDGKMTQEEFTNLEDNELYYTFDSPKDMYQKGLISHESSEAISEWVSRNSWEYRAPNEHWEGKNIQWAKFQTLLKDENNSLVKFYNVIKHYEQEANQQLAPGSRLQGNRLPSIIRSTEERIAYRDSVKSIGGYYINKEFNILSDETERGVEGMQDEQGNELHFIPTYFTGKTDLDTQSYDLGTMYLRFYQMAVNYGERREILPEMEMARFFINNRDITKLDPKGNKIVKSYKVIQDKAAEHLTKSKGVNQLADQFNDFFEMVMYGIKEKNEGTINLFGLTIDKGKAANALNKYTSLTLLSLNVRAGVNNVLMGEALQTAEAFAGQHMTAKSYTKANAYYWKHSMDLVGDIGSRDPKGMITKLYEHFQASPEMVDTNLQDNTKAKMAAKRGTLFFIMHMGDFYMQTRLFLGMLANKEAFDKDGNSLGSMLDFYSNDEYGHLKLDEKVDLIKSNWTKEDQQNFTFKTKGIMAGIHGEYSEIGKSAMQRYAIGRLAITFRKFIVPGFKRRWKSRSYVERMGDYTEGSYITTYNFLKNLAIDMVKTGNTMTGDWDNLSQMEKANIIRTGVEVAFLVASIILAGIFIGGAKGDDDDEWFYTFMGYEMVRMKTELLFFSPKIDESLQLLQSPMASMSMFKNVVKLTKQLYNPLEEYQIGKHKGESKLGKVLLDFTPARALYQLRDTKQALNLMNQ